MRCIKYFIILIDIIIKVITYELYLKKHYINEYWSPVQSQPSLGCSKVSQLHLKTFKDHEQQNGKLPLFNYAKLTKMFTQ